MPGSPPGSTTETRPRVDQAWASAATPARSCAWPRSVLLSKTGEPISPLVCESETSLPERAFLRETAAERWSAAQTGQAEAVHVVDRDVILIGGGEDADVKIGTVLTPRIVAVLVRGHGGFSMNQVAGWPWQARVNGRVVSDREPLEEGDVITVGGRAFTFHRGPVRDL